MLGLSRNTWFLIGGVMLVVVLYFGFAGDEGDAKDDATAQAKKGKKRKGKRKREKTRAGDSSGVGVGKMCAKIDCNEAQLASFKSMVKEHRKNTSSQRRGLAEAHAKIAAELAEDTLDTEALDEAFEDATAHRAEMDNSARGVLEAMHAKLSAPQRESLAKMVARHGPSMLLARPSATSKKPQSKPKKGRRRKKGKTSRAQLDQDAFQAENTEQDEAPAAELSAAPQAGLAPAPAGETAVALDDADAVPELDEPVAQ
ncbi:MAG: periplasmic heavy metal sensor [Nannocystales bacterium]